MSAAQPAVGATAPAPLAAWLREATPAALFGLRLWASVCVSLYVAFSLELSEPSWAATTAALTCQPLLGASLRKASFRMVGTVVGAIAIVILAAYTRQDRVTFLVGLALWSAACAFVATVLRNFAAYAAALAGYTAAIIAISALGPVGSTGGSVTTFAINRAIEICIGIVSAGVVLALTDLGHARRTLAAEFASVTGGILDGFIKSLVIDGGGEARSRPVRRDLLRRVIALDPTIDAAIGEASDLRYRSAVLQGAVIGLVGMISAWRKAALEIERMDSETARREMAAVRGGLPLDEFSRLAPDAGAAPAELRQACCQGARALVRLGAETPTKRLMADTVAKGMAAAARALNGLTLLVDPRNAIEGRGRAWLHAPDLLPPLVNAARTLVVMAILSLFWIETAWPNGVTAITFGAVIVILLSIQGDSAYEASMTFLQGCIFSVVVAAIYVFWLLPQVTTFPGLCLALGLSMVPCGFFVALPWRPMFFFAGGVNIIPMLSLNNAMTYDASQFWNSNISILIGIAVATVAMRVIPPVPPAVRTRRLLALTLADLRKLVRRSASGRRRAWESRIIPRLLAVPEQASANERAALAGALSVGVEILRLRRVSPRVGATGAVDGALAALADGRSGEAVARLAALDRELTLLPSGGSAGRAAMALRASILVVSEELEEFAPYFDGDAP